MGKEEKKDDGNAEGVGMRELIRETVLGYVFWSLFQALAPVIWFYPLNEMEISGYEAFAVSLFSPALLFLPPLRWAVRNRWGVAVLRLAGLACVGSFQAPTLLQRLIMVAIGCGFQMLVFVATLWNGSERQRTMSCWGLILGLFSILSSRVWYVTVLPTWWSQTTNSAVIALGAIAIFDKAISGEDASPAKEPFKSTLRPNWFITGTGFGTLLFLTHLLFGELSVLTRWTVKSYPDTGPMPYPWGIAVLLALWLGISMAPCGHVVHSKVWWLIGSACLLGLYLLDTWAAFTCGLVVGVFTLSIWPEMVDRLTACPPGRTAALVGIVYVFNIVFEVWTVAYNFVPGGEFTREHTGYQLGFVIFILGLALHHKSRGPDHKSNTAFVKVQGENMPNTQTSILLLLIVLAGAAGFVKRYPAQTFSHPQKSETKAEFTAAIWAYHFGYDNFGWPSLDRTADFLNKSGADVVALLESDASKPFLGNNDFGQWLTEKLGVYNDFGPSTRDHTWGNLLISKYPIVKSSHHLLPSPHGELAPAIHATINFTGHLVDFVITHMGNDQDVLDRKLQAEVLAELLDTSENPVVFLGYVTSAPGSRDYMQLTKRGRVLDIDTSDKDRWCEYIMYRGLIKQGYARVSHGGLSDTELQMAKFQIPDDPEFKDNTKVTTNPKDVETRLHFPKVFGKHRPRHNWHWVHNYHMNTPKYFTP